MSIDIKLRPKGLGEPRWLYLKRDKDDKIVKIMLQPGSPFGRNLKIDHYLF